GDAFEVYPPGGSNWSIHDNTIADCPTSMLLDGYGGPTSVLRSNVVSGSGGAPGAAAAVDVRGEWSLVDNLFSGFSQPVLALSVDRFGQPIRSPIRGNVFRRCVKVLDDGSRALWGAAAAEGNRFIDCAEAPSTGGTASKTPALAALARIAAPARPRLLAPRPPAKLAIDGDVAEWPWGDKARVALVAQTPDGQPIASPRSLLLAAADQDWLYLSIRVVTPPNYTVHPAADPYNGDGMEVAFRSAQPGAPAAILMLYGSADGRFWPHPSGGASGAQMAQLASDTRYATRPGKDQWTAEWRIPRAVLGAGQAGAKRLQFNVGIFHQAAGLWVAWVGIHQAAGLWVAWVGTGAEVFRVESAGEMVTGG
ncbi:MAG: hypothetical protein HYU66_10135, partial [Armatimonadetes bacterium]|nr:hypothetical protein [Armatimonadota bacterium]